MLSDQKSVSDAWGTVSMQTKIFKYTFADDTPNYQDGLASLGVMMFFR